MVAACAAADDAGESSGPVSGKADFYGSDDRQEILDAADPRVVGWARATAVVVSRTLLVPDGPGYYRAAVSTMGDRYNLCPGERFTDEPVLGFCSSYLVAPDLVATAGHCFEDAFCSDTAFVFDFYKGGASANVSAIPAANVFTCKELVARELRDGIDHALVRLDRPVRDRTPFALQPSPPAIGARVGLVGYASGTFAKVDLAGKVLRIEGDRIRTSLDSFPGHSGGVVIDLATGRAFGVHVEGSSPSYVAHGTCTRAVACDAATPDAESCDGAVESSVAAFGSCVTAPDSCARDVTTASCVSDGAPCDTSQDCGDAMCTCESERATTESFMVGGRCLEDRCDDLFALCTRACDAYHLDNLRFSLAWWKPVCKGQDPF
jgi:hypothetical protein